MKLRNICLVALFLAVCVYKLMYANIYVYVAIFIVPTSLFLINLKLTKNILLFERILMFDILFYITSAFFLHREFKENLALSTIFFLISMSIIVSLFAYSIVKWIKKSEEGNSEPVLFTKRVKDKERIIQYFKNFNTLGIDSEWGTGKTFVVNAFKKDMVTEYEFIEIDVLTSNLNEMRSTLIEQFEALLQSNGIFPKYANQLKEKINAIPSISKITGFFSVVFTTSSSNSEVLKNFREEVNKLDKKVLIIYEDLDRIDDIKVIKEIFAISEKLASDKIHVLYQYDKRNLLEIGFSEEYLEKYLPYTMQLTPLAFKELVEYKCEELDSKILNANEIIEVFKPKTYYVLQRLELMPEPTLNLDFSTARTVENMINELYTVLQNKEAWGQENKKVLISFFIVKHYMKDSYEKLQYFKALDEVFKIKMGDNTYTLTELVHLAREEEVLDLLDVIRERENNLAYCILSFFRYPVRELFLEDKEPEAVNCAYRAEQIDRVIWKSLAEGASELTDHENAVEGMKRVLDEPKENWSFKYEELFAEFYNLNEFKNGNKTIFMIGSSSTLSIFKSFKMVGVENNYRQKLMEFYFHIRKNNNIDLDYIQHLNLISIENIRDYRIVLRNFINSKVVMNFNHNENFSVFLQKYIGAIATVGIMRTTSYVEKGMEGEWEWSLNNLSRYLEREFERVRNIPKVAADINLVEKFIMKLIEILKCDAVLEEPSLGINITFNSEVASRDFDRIIRQIKDSPNEQDKILDLYYSQGEININQIKDIVESVEKI